MEVKDFAAGETNKDYITFEKRYRNVGNGSRLTTPF